MATRIVKLESKVTEVRDLVRAGKIDAAWQVMQQMMDKYVTRYIAKEIAKRGFNADNTTDALAEAQTACYTEWLSLKQQEQHWEKAFGWCMKCTVQNVLARYNNNVHFGVEVQMSATL